MAINVGPTFFSFVVKSCAQKLIELKLHFMHNAYEIYNVGRYVSLLFEDSKFSI